MWMKEEGLLLWAATVNVDTIEISIHGFPFMFHCTVADVEPGEELLTSYGEAYWELIRECELRIVASPPSLRPDAAATAAANAANAAACAALAASPAPSPLRQPRVAGVAGVATVADMMMDAGEEEETGSGVVGLGASRATTTTTTEREAQRSVESEDIARTASAEEQGQEHEQAQEQVQVQEQKQEQEQGVGASAAPVASPPPPPLAPPMTISARSPPVDPRRRRRPVAATVAATVATSSMNDEDQCHVVRPSGVAACALRAAAERVTHTGAGVEEAAPAAAAAPSAVAAAAAAVASGRAATGVDGAPGAPIAAAARPWFERLKEQARFGVDAPPSSTSRGSTEEGELRPSRGCGRGGGGAGVLCGGVVAPSDDAAWGRPFHSHPHIYTLTRVFNLHLIKQQSL